MTLLAVAIAAYLAHETDCVNINLLHLSSAKAVESAVRMAAAYPHIDFRREVTVSHLLADIGTAQGRAVTGSAASSAARRRATVGGLIEWLPASGREDLSEPTTLSWRALLQYDYRF